MTRLALGLALLAAGCSDAAPPPGSAPSPAPGSAAPLPAPTIQVLDYACESGETVQVAYPDVETAVLAYRDAAYELRFDASSTAEGATYADAEWSWRTVGGAGELSPAGGEVVERCAQAER